MQVVFRNAEEACTDWAIGGQTAAVAMAAKRLAHRGDGPDLRPPIGEGPALGRLGNVLGLDRAQVEAGLQAPESFPARPTISLSQARPESRGMNSMNRSESDFLWANSARDSISWSLMPLMTTALTFSEFNSSKLASAFGNGGRYFGR